MRTETYSPDHHQLQKGLNTFLFEKNQFRTEQTPAGWNNIIKDRHSIYKDPNSGSFSVSLENIIAIDTNGKQYEITPK